MKSNLMVLTVTILLCAGCTSLRQSVANRDATIAEIERTHRAWIDAAIRGDADAFGSHMADEYVALIANGRTLDKAAWMKAIRSGTSRFEAVELRDARVQLHGETAVLIVSYTQTAMSSGRDNNGSGVEMDTWVRRGGRWLVVSSAWSRSTSAPGK